MIHIKETEIIPFLKTAQTGYTKMISEGDLEMEVELAEKVEEALTQAMDIIYDYQSMAAILVSAMVHDQTESKSFQFLWQMGRDNK